MVGIEKFGSLETPESSLFKRINVFMKHAYGNSS